MRFAFKRLEMTFGSVKVIASQKQVSYQDGNNAMVNVADTEGFTINGIKCLINKLWAFYFDFLKLKKIGIVLKRQGILNSLTANGVRVKWDDEMTIYVTVDEQYKNRMKGLCGDYDDNNLSKNTQP